MDEIVNRVAQSSLVVFDLEDLYPPGERKSLDLSQWLEGGVVLREKEFRARLKDFDWSAYADSYVNLFCSTEAILPAWAIILVSSELNPLARRVVVGSREELETLLYEDALRSYPYDRLEGKAVLLKGCSRLPVPCQAYLSALQRIQPFARSVSFGEACSSVPILKKKKDSAS